MDHRRFAVPWAGARAIVLGLAIAFGLALGCAGAQPDLERALAAVGTEALRAHVAFLADDRLEGRGTGTRGYALAAAYVAAQFDSIGLEPASDRGFLLPVPYVESKVDFERSAVSLIRDDDERRLELGTHFVLAGDPEREDVTVDAPVVFAGYGVTAPEFGHDDFAGLEVRGRIVCLIRGAPPRFPHNERAYYSWGRGKAENLSRRGAVGILTLRSSREETTSPWDRLVRRSQLGRLHWLASDGRPSGALPGLDADVTLSRAGAESLFQGSAVPLDSALARAERGVTIGFELPVRLKVTTASRHGRLDGPNVAGILRGSDPALREEYVVYSAHLDHLGISEPVEGDSINNGAYDNASGVAVMIETARALRGLAKPPRRSILFLATSGEEHGLLGAEYFTEFPPVPLGKIVADINLDEFLMLEPVRSLVAFGAEHSSLGLATGRAVRRAGFALLSDPMPEEVVFVRSDQFPFVRKGVPAVFLMAGSDDRAGDSPIHRWNRTIYHSPSDDMTQAFDWDSGVRFVRANTLLGWQVANDPRRPAWNRGDFFGRRFGQIRTVRR